MATVGDGEPCFWGHVGAGGGEAESERGEARLRGPLGRPPNTTPTERACVRTRDSSGTRWSRRRPHARVDFLRYVLGEYAEQFRLLVETVKDYAIYVLAPDGTVATWNAGAERFKGYRPEEIIGHSFTRFYVPEDVESGKPARALGIATKEGRYEEEGWRVRKDGSRFWASIVITALRDARGEVVGFGKVTRDITERKRVDEQHRRSEARLQLAQEIARIGTGSRHQPRDSFTRDVPNHRANLTNRGGSGYGRHRPIREDSCGGSRASPTLSARPA